MREITKIELDGESYWIQDWQVEDALSNLVWAIKTFGEPFMELVGADETVEDGEAMKLVIKTLIKQIDDADFRRRIRIMLKGVKYKGQDINYEMHFQGRLMHLLKLVFYCMRHNFQDFLEEGPEMLGQMGLSFSQETSTSS